MVLRSSALVSPSTVRPRAARGAVVVVLAAALGLAGCGNGEEPTDDGTGSPTPTETTEPAQTGEPTDSPTPTVSPSPGDTSDDGDDDAPPFPADTEPDTGEAAGGEVGTLTDIRLGGHEGFDRVVFELTGPGTPSWNVRYVDEAIQDASGMAVDVDGDAVLEVTLFNVSIPEPDERFYDGPDTIRADGTEQVEEVVYTSLFEGYLQTFIGVDDGEQPFRAYSLDDPARIVIEVQDT